jgi:hypothetical protein
VVKGVGMSNSDDEPGAPEAAKFASLRGRAIVATCSLVLLVVASTFFTLLHTGSSFFYPGWEEAVESGDTPDSTLSGRESHLLGQRARGG